MIDPMNEYRTLSVMPTYQCTAACDHCGTYSHPKEKTRLPEEVMLSAIDQAIASDYKLVVFTGGEPTLAKEMLLRGIKRAALGHVITRVVTNAWWASDDVSASEWIDELKAAGLFEINFSTGDQHARFVSLENVLRATKAAAKAKLAICIMVEIVQDRSITREKLETHPIYLKMLEESPDAYVRILESPWTPLSFVNINQYPDGITLNKHNLVTRTGCNSCLSTTTLQANGQLGACCGLGMREIPELQLGDIRNVPLAQADENAANDFLKRWIRVEGPEKILAWAAEHDKTINWENMYAHKCQSCIKLYKDEKVRNVIKEHHTEKLGDVLLGEWLLYQYRPEENDENETPPDDTVSNITW